MAAGSKVSLSVWQAISCPATVGNQGRGRKRIALFPRGAMIDATWSIRFRYPTPLPEFQYTTIIIIVITKMKRLLSPWTSMILLSSFFTWKPSKLVRGSKSDEMGTAHLLTCFYNSSTLVYDSERLVEAWVVQIWISCSRVQVTHQFRKSDSSHLRCFSFHLLFIITAYRDINSQTSDDIILKLFTSEYYFAMHLVLYWGIDYSIQIWHKPRADSVLQRY